jgi:hypothetical protein
LKYSAWLGSFVTVGDKGWLMPGKRMGAAGFRETGNS